jgi:hypothetical protein
MTPEILVAILSVTLLTKFIFVPLLTVAVPRRFSVRQSLIWTAIVAVVIGGCQGINWLFVGRQY